MRVAWPCEKGNVGGLLWAADWTGEERAFYRKEEDQLARSTACAFLPCLRLAVLWYYQSVKVVKVGARIAGRAFTEA